MSMLYTKLFLLSSGHSAHKRDASGRFAHNRLMPQPPQAQESRPAAVSWFPLGSRGSPAASFRPSAH